MPKNVTSPDFIHFNLVSKTLKLSNVDATSQVCNGLFCDGQPKTDCRCLEVDNRKSSWVLTADVEYTEVHYKATIRSKSLITFFAPKCRVADPDKAGFDVLDLSDCVDRCLTRINSKSGWRIFGWLKPTESPLEATNYEFDIHIVSIRPVAGGDVEEGWSFISY